ncbi:P-loop containing nucleoside triphosphate hydrolases superfamily protein [Perilla frutescens var. hirtella]|nr:P-loop containing nucleoside triphosphate hydrolases superfamily protein [Perilla frutescens var. hirtella]
MSQNGAPAKMEEQDQKKEGSATATTMPSPQRKNKIIPMSPRGAIFKEEFLSKILPWEKLTASLDNFPLFIEENTKTLLMECVASHLKQKKLRKNRGRFTSSSERILLQSIPGTELYRERLVSTLARELQVPLMKLDSSVLPPYDLRADFNNDGRADCSDYDEFDDDEFDSDEDDEFTADDSDEKVITKVCEFKKGDRVMYSGKPVSIEEANNRTLSSGQRGEVYEVKGERVAVVFNICGLKTTKAEKDEGNTETFRQALVTWLDVKNVKQDLDAQTHDYYVGMEVLHEVLESQPPMIVYFPDSFLWPSMPFNSRKQFLDPYNFQSMPYDIHKQLPGKMKEIFNQLPEGVVMICAENKWEPRSEDMEKYPEFLKKDIEKLQGPWGYQVSEMQKLFTNVVCMKPPKDQDLLNTFIKQIEEDRLIVISEGNLSRMHKVLKAHNLVCMNLEHANVEDMILTRENVEKIIGWATSHYLSSCPFPHVNKEKLHIPHESIKLAIMRFKEEEETQLKKQSKSVEHLATGRHEKCLVSAVVRSEDIGVKFDDVGALENVKKVLHETVILPMRRPELFSHGNLLRPCKGILLFGPPGTGKTLVAKALATESGTNFINITAATITSMWVGETENLTRAVFSFASKLAPVIIFIDEVDSLLGSRGHNHYDTSRLNEFMAAWDGLKSKESQRILVIGATNRPFDLDEAVIRRMPRRIYVGLPDVENRSKILKVILKKENLESGFSYEQLANATEGYSGSDLKNLCVAAAYRPIEELLEQESKAEASDGVPAPALRPLNLNDFIHSKAKVRPSVSCNASSIMRLREWNKQYGQGESQGQQNKDLELSDETEN